MKPVVGKLSMDDMVSVAAYAASLSLEPHARGSIDSLFPRDISIAPDIC